MEDEIGKSKRGPEVMSEGEQEGGNGNKRAKREF